MVVNSTKIFSWKTTIVLFFGMGLLIAGLLVFIPNKNHIVQSFPIENLDSIVNSPTSTNTLLDSVLEDKENLIVKIQDSLRPVVPALVTTNLGFSFEVPAKPARLIIPSIGVDTSIQSVGLSWKNNGEMGIPTNFTDVAWYNGSSLPGSPGSAVIAGHLDGKNVPKAVFYNLLNLKYGDLVKVIDKNNKSLQFQVIDTKIYNYDDPTESIFISDASKTRLNLITCGGNWIKSQKLYDKRIVVFTELITD